MNSYLIKNINLLDGSYRMQPRMDCDILVEDGHIVKIGEKLPFTGKTLDYKGAWVTPGLINMHVHLPGSGKVGGRKVADLSGLIRFIKSNPLSEEIGMAITASGAKTELFSGVTTLRAVGGVGNFDTRLAKRIAAGRAVGPRILAANEAICTPGGHMEGTVSKAVSDVAEAVKLVEETKNAGADLIKLMITGGVLDCKVKGHPGELKMSAEMVKACCDKAHELGLKVAAHVEGPEGIEIAARCGVDTIEHGAPVSDEALKMLKSRNGALICTLSPAIPLSLIDPEQTGYGEDCRYNTEVLLKGMIGAVEACLAKGIPVGLGTDTGCPYVTHYDMWRELFYYAKYIRGVDNNFALHTATAVNAEILGIDNVTGTVEEGKTADLLIVKENPLRDLTALKDPSAVIAGGKIYTRKNKKYENIEAALNRLM